MNLPPDITAALSRALGSPVTGASATAGGDINQAGIVQLEDGRSVFVKWNRQAPEDMFAAEAEGLAWLAEAGAIRVPQVLAIGADHLALERITRGRPARDFDERLGRGLATLHRCAPGSFGLSRDNYIGTLSQANEPRADWASFYRDLRLRPQVNRAAQAGWLDTQIVRDFHRLFDRMAAVVGPPEPPARLHGDLWAGNHMVDEGGWPVLIDPAVYGGHREIDLAMMRLFGGYGTRLFAAYAEAYPLAPGASDRVPVYQLYPLLVHVNLFGSSYCGQLAAALSRALALAGA